MKHSFICLCKQIVAFTIISFSFLITTAFGRQKSTAGSKSAVGEQSGGGIKKVEVNIKDVGAKGDGVSNDIPAFDSAKALIKRAGGGTMYFPAGKYMSDKNGWRVYASNITLRGDGIDKTWLLTPDHSNAAGLQLSLYRDAGWNLAPGQQYTYEDNAKEGDLFLKLKPGQDLRAFAPGTIFFISAGASYYDQYYGEFNIVRKVAGNTVYLTYPLGRDYTTESSTWYGKLTEAFVPPPAGETAVAYMKNPPGKNYRSTLSLANNLYEVMNADSNRVTLKNLGKGNETSVLLAGTKVYRGRSVCITPSTSYNVQVQDMTVDGHRGAVGLSNSVKTRFNRVKFVFHPGTKNDGLWLDGDDGRDCIMKDCIAQSDSINPSQFARSFSDIKILHSVFQQVSIDFTEFNANCEVANCTFTIKSPDGTNRFPNSPAITVGASTYNTFIHDNIIHVYRRGSAIASQPDIQTYPRNHLYKTLITHNTIDAEKCFGAISIIAFGDTRITHNTITGSLNYVFGGSGASLYVDSTLPDKVLKQWQMSSVCRLDSNIFTGRTDGFFFRPADHVIIEGNAVYCLGDNTAGGNKQILQSGNIISGAAKYDPIPASLFVLKNNTFTGWNYTEHSINFTKPITKAVVISNNRFIDNVGSFRKDKDFKISFTQ